MQTFLPYAGFAASAAVLDNRRLGKQRVEALQVIQALRRPDHGWRHHPAVKMWAGYEEALAAYALAVCAEWCRRGHSDTCALKVLQEVPGLPRIRSQEELAAAGALPPWLGDEAFHQAHRSALVRKQPEHYRPHFPDVPDDLPYIWPVPGQ